MALRSDEGLTNKKGIAKDLNNIGIVYNYQGDYPKALDYDFKTLKIYEELKDKLGIAKQFCNIGIVNGEQEDHLKALDYYFKALRAAEELEDKNGIAINFGNIGLQYYAQKNYTKSLVFYFKALKIAEDLNDKNGIERHLGNIGLAFAAQANYPKALDCFFKALKLAREFGDKNGIAIHLGNIGLLYTKTGKFKEAEQYLKIAISMDDSIGALDYLRQFEESLSQLYDSTGQYKLALIHYKKAIALKDTLFSQENKKQLIRREMNYEFEKKEAVANAEHKKELENQQALAEEKNRKHLILLIASLAFALIVFILLYYRSKFIQKSKLEKEINLQQKLRFKAVLDAEEKERRRIAQELHDGLGQLLSTLKLNVSAIENFVDAPNINPLNNSLSLIDTACDEVRTISHNMMPSVLIRLGLLPALRELVRKINESKQLVVNMEVDLDKRLDESAEAAIYRIVQEVLNNIIKHSKAKTAALILKRNGDDFSLQITDDGIGFVTLLVDKSEGIGWKNIYTRAGMLNGTVDVISAPSAGMEVKIYFKKLFSGT